MGSIEHPLAALVQQKLLDRSIINIGRNLEVLACIDKICSSIRADEFNWAPDSNEAPKGVNEARCIKRLDEFYVNGSYAHTGE